MNITNKQTGFTLIELMLVVVLLAILVAIGVPSFRELIMNNRITTSTNEFASALSLARIEAIKRGTGTVITANTGGGASNEWGNGFVVSVWDDVDNDNVVDSPDEIGVTLRDVEAFSSDVTFDSAGDRTEISFLYSGAYNSTTSDQFTLCDSRTGETGRQFTLNTTGTFNLNRGFTCP